jgi:hypothetical protein
MKSLRLLGIIIFLLIPCLSAKDAKLLKFDLFLKDTDNDKYIISLPYGMAFDKDESVYILDFKECNILKFSKDGKYVTAIGRKGMGPGEIHSPGYITVKNDKLYYIDMVNLINVYDTDGKVIKSERKKMTGSNEKAYPEKFIIGSDFDKIDNKDFLKVWDWDGHETDVIDEISWDKYLKTSKDEVRILAIAATNTDIHVFDMDSHGAVIYAKTNNYEVYKWIGGKKETIIKENHHYKLLPNEKRKKNRLEKKNGMTTFYISNDYYQVIREIMVDKDDNIWLVTNSVDRAGLAKYSNDGKFIAFYEIEPWYLIEHTNFYMSNNYIYCSEGTSEGYKFFRTEIPK